MEMYYNVQIEYFNLILACLILFLMLYTKPRRTIIYNLNFVGIVISIISIIIHCCILWISNNVNRYNPIFFNILCITYHILYAVILRLCYDYIARLTSNFKKRVYWIKKIENSIMIIYTLFTIYAFMAVDMYSVTKNYIIFSKFFNAYIIVGIIVAIISLITSIINRKYLARVVRMLLYIFILFDIVVLLLQLRNDKIIFISISYVIPFLLFYIIFHSTPFDEVAGGQGKDSFETRFLDYKYIHKNCSVIFIEISRIIIDGEYHAKEQYRYFEAEKCREIEMLSKSISIYKLNDNQYAFIFSSKDSNEEHTLISKIREILDEPIIYMLASLKLRYRMVVFHNNSYITDPSRMYSLISYCLNNLGTNSHNSCYICTDEDYEAFYKQYQIERLLIDIRNKNDLNDERVLCYTQPIYSINHNSFRTAEALMRLKLGDEIIYPDSFISIAEQTGCIHSLTCIILNKVCQAINKIDADYDFDAITVNCSTTEMSDTNMYTKFLDIIKENKTNPSHIRLELTESAMYDDFNAINYNIQMLKKNGVNFYLDDFGTGYSNLERIMNFPFMTIKFDKSLLYKAISDNKMDELVEGMVNIFKKRGFILLVEGVENDEQSQYSINKGFDYIQGYKYAKPIPINELINYFSKK